MVYWITDIFWLSIELCSPSFPLLLNNTFLFLIPSAVNTSEHDINIVKTQLIFYFFQGWQFIIDISYLYP